MAILALLPIHLLRRAAVGICARAHHGMVDKMNAAMNRNFRVSLPYAQENNNAATKLLDTLLMHLQDVANNSSIIMFMSCLFCCAIVTRQRHGMHPGICITSIISIILVGLSAVRRTTKDIGEIVHGGL